MLKPCSAAGPQPCCVKVAEACPAGLHTVWRTCCQARAPPCRAEVADHCAGAREGEKHLLRRRCCDAPAGYVYCCQAEAHQTRIQEHEERVRRCAVWQIHVDCNRRCTA